MRLVIFIILVCSCIQSVAIEIKGVNQKELNDIALQALDSRILEIKSFILQSSKRKLIKGAFNKLPLKVKRKVLKNVERILVVENLGSSGRTIFFKSNQNKYIDSSIIFLDSSIVNDTSNNPIVERIKSSFKKNSELEINISGMDSYDAKLTYILSHEIGHVLAFFDNQELNSDKWIDNFKKNFGNFSWSIGEDEFRLANVALDTIRKKIKYFEGKSSDYSELLSLVKSEAFSSSFNSFYSITNPSEDFADSFAMGVYKLLFKSEIKYTLVERRSRKTWIFVPCTLSGKCKGKINAIYSLLK